MFNGGTIQFRTQTKHLNRPKIRTKISAVPRGPAITCRTNEFPEPANFAASGVNPARSTILAVTTVGSGNSRNGGCVQRVHPRDSPDAEPEILLS